MAKTFRAWEIDQVWMLPPTVRDLVPAGHVAHFVGDTVRQDLDLSAIFSSYPVSIAQADRRAGDR